MLFYVTDGNIMYLTDASRFLISCVIQHYAPVVGGGGGGGTDAYTSVADLGCLSQIPDPDF